MINLMETVNAYYSPEFSVIKSSTGNFIVDSVISSWWWISSFSGTSVLLKAKVLNTFFYHVDLWNALAFPFYIVLLGFIGVIFCKDKGFVLLLLFMEMLLFGLNLGYIIISFYNQDPLGHLYVLMMLTLAAGESVIGLSIVLKYYFDTKFAYVKDIKILRG
jgi:NADH:ubiquinone oxidoreductase subunit K